MKNTKAITLPLSEKNLSGEVLLLRNFHDYIDDTIKALNIGKSDNAQDFLIISENFPLIDADTLKKAFNKHKEGCFETTALTLTEREEIPAAFLTENAFKKADLSLKTVAEILSSIDSKGCEIGMFLCENTEYLSPIHNAKELYLANEKLRLEVIDKAMENGAIFTSLDGIIISPAAKIGAGTQILPNTIIKGNSSIGENCIIGPNSVIDSCEIDSDCVINASQLTLSKVGKGTKIGPFTQLRPDSVIGENVKIGDFVEIKNSSVGNGTSVAHLTYIGDSDVGERVNFGCGTVTVNYDGKNKHRTVIEDYAFIGCNSNLVAPIKIGKNAFTAAGSTVTHDIPDDALYISREKNEKIIEKWVEKRLGHRRIEDKK